MLEPILASEDRKKSKRAGLWVTARDPSRKVNQMSKAIWDRKIIPKSISSTRTG